MDIKFDYNYKKYVDKIKKLYLEAFPEDERRSFKEIRSLLNNKNGEIISIIYKNNFAGFFMILKNKKAKLIDYFAIKKDFRGKSIGSLALNKLDDGSPLIIEVEPIDEKSDNNRQRIKRISFYEKLGFVSSKKLVSWHDTKFEIMGLNEEKTIDRYFRLVDDIFTQKERKKIINLLN